MTTYVCPVCRYPGLTEPPRTDAGPSYEICPSCGFEFGVTDDDHGVSDDDWRRRWVAAGAPWRSTTSPPAGWDGVAQLGE
ncbi:hypothetical protein [Rhodococcoides corynebacterioides]|uniref:Uncharacterized protein n=1 Tax=Rhodococcoides corynebacterioides TaxID=53972 RepID=A0ABS7P404_9NOCA|nr:hypothetical protein [Rhodococcus corynebacterioides]MBY6366607.1 hypothetical protein [Rhodococcus corynebacterioides]MBY6408670.1 hypothetical protein [Rhodococcus corynebacterioides]